MRKAALMGLGQAAGNKGHRVNKSVLDCAVVKQIVDATSVPQAWQVMRTVVRDFGFDNLLYGTNRLLGPGIFGEKKDTFFLSDLPEDIMGPLWQEELYRTIPVAIWAIQNEGAKSLRHGGNLYHAGILPPEQAKTQKQLTDMGVTSGYVIGFNRPGQPVVSAMAMINFGRNHDQTEAVWKAHAETIMGYVSIFHLRVNNLPVPIPSKRLTRRQSEVLKWVGAGKTTAEIATILGLSPATIEKHLRQVRDTLGVSTTTQAVLHAQINSQIFSIAE